MANESISAFSPVIEERAFLKSADKQQIAYVKGVDYHYSNVVKLDSAMQVGTWLDPEYPNTAVIGNGLAFKLSLGIMNYGTPLEIIVPKIGTSFLNPNSTRTIETQILGMYTGTEEFQNKFVFVTCQQAQRLLDYEENQFTAIEIKLKPDVVPEDFSYELQKELGPEFKVQTKTQSNELLFLI
jgi:lipoprotein-releasing system permease protein